MERKFKSKLVPVKASEVRKQANVQLKESIEHSKFRQIEPIDYDSYLEQNSSTIRSDICSKQLILLPPDDLTALVTNETSSEASKPTQDSLVNNLFVNDCLRTYERNEYVVKYKYHAYGGNYRQLPGYAQSQLSSQISEDLSYEIDAAENFKERNKSLKGALHFNKKQQNYVAQEKNGWLNYRLVTNQTEKNLKKRYFHLRRLDAPISSRNHAVEARYRKLNSEIHESNQMYVLEFFKEVPGLGKRNEMPKNHIMFDSNITNIRSTHNLHGAYSFEITETDPTCNQSIQHIFVADNQTRFEEWFTLLRDVMTNQSQDYQGPCCQDQGEPLSEQDTSNSFDSYKSPQLDALVNDKINCLATPSSPESSASRDRRIATAVVSSVDTSPENTLDTKSNPLDLAKYLNESEEDLLGDRYNQGQKQVSNLFDLFPKESGELVNEETELECDWPEVEIGRRFLLEFEHFKLNLNLPLMTSGVTSIKSSLFKENRENRMSIGSGSIPMAINPELFYLAFSLFDVRNNQKISENFYCIPNYDIFSNQLKTTKSSSSKPGAKNRLLEANANGVNTLSKTVFSLDGQSVQNIQSIASGDGAPGLVKRAHLNNVRRALFKVVDVHEDIFLVARIEKCLDGASVHSSIQPYLSQIQSENNRIKTAIKLHKKNQQTIKTKLANYRQPFAWAAKQLFRKG